jgi:hypothetical protein
MNVTANSVSVRDPHQAARRGGRYGREQQGEFHSSFSLLKRNTARNL